jgi:hypothetical protein
MGTLTLREPLRLLETCELASLSGLTPNAVRAAAARGELGVPFAETRRGKLYSFEAAQDWLRKRAERKRTPEAQAA